MASLCKACGARNPDKNGHHWGCGTLGKKAVKKTKKEEGKK